MPNEPGKTTTLLDISRIRERLKKQSETPAAGAAGSLDAQIELLKKLPQAITSPAKSPHEVTRGERLTAHLKALVEYNHTIAESVQILTREVEKYQELTRAAEDEAGLTPEEKDTAARVRLEAARNLDNLRAEIDALRLRLKEEPHVGNPDSPLRRFTRWLKSITSRVKH